jgi:hypothetical protein
LSSVFWANFNIYCDELHNLDGGSTRMAALGGWSCRLHFLKFLMTAADGGR